MTSHDDFRSSVTKSGLPVQTRQGSVPIRQFNQRGFTVPELLLATFDHYRCCFWRFFSPLFCGCDDAARRDLNVRTTLKQINLALAMYHDVFNTFPTRLRLARCPVDGRCLPGDRKRLTPGGVGSSSFHGPGNLWPVALIDFNLDPTDAVNFGTAGTSTIVPRGFVPQI